MLIQNLFIYRNLIWQLTIRNIKSKNKGSHFGLAWILIKPLLLLILYIGIFGYIFGGKFDSVLNETRSDYALGVFTGLSIMQFISDTINLSPTMIISQPNFVKKVVFPLDVLSVATICSLLVNFIVCIFLICLGSLFWGRGLYWSILWLPVIIAPVIIMSIGISWFVSSLGVFFRDIGQVTDLFSIILMYSSAVVYSPSKVPESILRFIRFNPILHAIELTRNAILWNKTVANWYLLYLYICGLVIFFVGGLTFRLLKPSFADEL
jgi:lipopolysaccharide transport system permease protein